MKPYSGQAIANAQGVAEIDLTPPPRYDWLVGHIAVSSNSTSNCTCSVNLNQRFICGTNIGTADSADGTPVPLRNGDTLRFVWAGCSAGAVCIAQILTDEAVIGQGLLATAGG